jgi:hypothetical protein
LCGWNQLGGVMAGGSVIAREKWDAVVQ